MVTKVITIIFTVSVLLGFSLAFAEEEIENLIKNGDFENDLVGWVLAQNIRGSVGSMAIDKKDVAEGDQSVHIKIDTAGADFHTVRIEQSGIPLERGEKYTISVWLKAEEKRTARPYIFDLAGGQPFFTYINEPVMIKNEWEEYFVTFDSDQETVNASVSVRVGEEDFDVWVDNIKLYRGKYVPSEFGEKNAVFSKDKLTTSWGSIKTQY